MSAPERLTGHRLRDYDHAVSVLYQARLSQDATLADIADRTGWNLQRVSRSLRGTEEMRSRSLFALADALGYDLALIPREDTP